MKDESRISTIIIIYDFNVDQLLSDLNSQCKFQRMLLLRQGQFYMNIK